LIYLIESLFVYRVKSGNNREMLDVTVRVEVYAKGKVFECDCGQGFGVGFDVASVKCPSCGVVCVDEDWEGRGAGGQTELGDWS